MARIVVLGAGVCGLAAGMALRRDGHEVTVLERDSDRAPQSVQEAWEHWVRQGVAQFHQPHIMLPRGRIALEAMLPDVVTALSAAGAARFDMLDLMPPSITDRTPRAGDDHLWTITARRPVLEQVLRRAAENEPGLQIRSGVSVHELVMSAYDGIPHVCGVRTDAGQELHADLVVDAMGRRSPLPRWLEAAGTKPVYEEADDAGFIYYTRFFHARDGRLPAFRAPLNTYIGTFSILTLPSDNDTWSVTVFISAGDRPLKRLREEQPWSRVVAACPLHAQWLEGEPITRVLAMGGVLDRYRRFSFDGQPIATGIAPVGDAWACTNPSQGRGMSLGLWHVQHLREVIREHLDDPGQFARVWGAVTEAELTPWYRETVAEDRARMAETEARRQGLNPAPASGHGALLPALQLALQRDPDAFRVFVAWRSCVTQLEEAFANQDLVERILEIAGNNERPPSPGPNLSQLLALLEAAPTLA